MWPILCAVTKLLARLLQAQTPTYTVCYIVILDDNTDDDDDGDEILDWATQVERVNAYSIKTSLDNKFEDDDENEDGDDDRYEILGVDIERGAQVARVGEQ